MIELIINVHSEVAIITNSSTTIYTQAINGSVDTVKEIINSLLSLGNSNYTSDDLFNVEVYSDELEEYREDRITDMDEYHLEIYEGLHYNDKIDQIYRKIETGEIEKPYFWDIDDDFSGDTSIKITCKTNDDKSKLACDILNKINNLFHSREMYC